MIISTYEQACRLTRSFPIILLPLTPSSTLRNWGLPQYYQYYYYFWSINWMSLSALIIIIISYYYYYIIIIIKLDAYKVARKCNGEEFCLEVPLDQVSQNLEHGLWIVNYDYIIIFPLNSRLVNASHSILWHVRTWSHPQKLALMVLSCSLPMSSSTLLRGCRAEWIIVIKTRSSSCCRLHVHSNNMIIIWHCLLWTLWIWAKYFISIYNIQYRPRLLVWFLDFVSVLFLIDNNNNNIITR